MGRLYNKITASDKAATKDWHQINRTLGKGNNYQTVFNMQLKPELIKIAKTVKKIGDIDNWSFNDAECAKQEKIERDLFNHFFRKPRDVRFITIYNWKWSESDYLFIKKVIEKDDFPLNRYEALRILTEIGKENNLVLPFYIKLLKDPDRGIRHYTALALSSHKNREKVQKLIEKKLNNLLEDDDKFVRYRAMTLIEKLPLADMGVYNKLHNMQIRETDEILKYYIKRAEEKIMARYYVTYYMKKKQSEIPQKFRVIERELEEDIERRHNKGVLNTYKNKDLGKNIGKEIDFIKKMKSDGAKAAVVGSELWSLLFDWEDYIIR